MVSQFISPDKVKLLGSIKFDFPEGTHAIGRLDNLSEGLLLLTTNQRITRLLFESGVPHKRTYLVKVKDIVSEETLAQLQQGVPICITGSEMYEAVPYSAAIVDPAGKYEPEGQHIHRGPHSWLEICLTEGKFHQVRKMVMALRHRCKRLIRISIEDMELGDLQPGCVHEFSELEFFTLLKLDKSSIASEEVTIG